MEGKVENKPDDNGQSQMISIIGKQILQTIKHLFQPQETCIDIADMAQSFLPYFKEAL